MVETENGIPVCDGGKVFQETLDVFDWWVGPRTCTVDH